MSVWRFLQLSYLFKRTKNENLGSFLGSKAKIISIATLATLTPILLNSCGPEKLSKKTDSNLSSTYFWNWSGYDINKPGAGIVKANIDIELKKVGYFFYDQYPMGIESALVHR